MCKWTSVSDYMSGCSFIVIWKVTTTAILLILEVVDLLMLPVTSVVKGTHLVMNVAMAIKEQ